MHKVWQPGVYCAYHFVCILFAHTKVEEASSCQILVRNRALLIPRDMSGSISGKFVPKYHCNFNLSVDSQSVSRRTENAWAKQTRWCDADLAFEQRSKLQMIIVFPHRLVLLPHKDVVHPHAPACIQYRSLEHTLGQRIHNEHTNSRVQQVVHTFCACFRIYSTLAHPCAHQWRAQPLLMHQVFCSRERSTCYVHEVFGVQDGGVDVFPQGTTSVGLPIPQHDRRRLPCGNPKVMPIRKSTTPKLLSHQSCCCSAWSFRSVGSDKYYPSTTVCV